MTALTGRTIDDLYGLVLDTLLEEGEPVNPRGLWCREIRGATLVLDSPSHNVLRVAERKLNYAFQVAEWLWIAAGLDDVRTISAYNKRIAEFSDNGKTFYGAYGPRIGVQLSQVVSRLLADPCDRRAIVSIWRAHDVIAPTKDPPCTLDFQFFVRNGMVEMHTHMRSNDVWLGLPYDLFTFTQLQRTVAARLDLPAGRYVHHVGSLHLYDANIEAANVVADELIRNWSESAYGIEAPISPAPGPYLNARTVVLMQQLAAGLPVTGAELHLAEITTPAWQEYARMLARRFHPGVSLDPFYRTLIQRS